jgi:hypothetical protein
LDWQWLARLPSAVHNREGALIRVHANPVNLNAHLDATYAAQKAAAAREAERTRKKLLGVNAEPAGEADAGACVVKLGAHEDSPEDTNRQSRQNAHARKREVNAENVNPVSDWA